MNALTPAPRQFTRAEFERIARAGGFGDLRVELRRGWIVEMSPQFAPLAALKAAIYDALRDQLRAAGGALRIWSEASVDWAEDFQPMPDIVVWESACVPPSLQGPLPGAAARLVIEIASTTLADDLGEKLEDYAAAGLAEYWVADVAARVMFRHDGPGAKGYARRLVTPLAERLESLTIPGLALPAGSLD
jgi:Uma2 family endonuclease